MSQLPHDPLREDDALVPQEVPEAVRPDEVPEMAAAEPVSVDDVVAESVSDVPADAEPHADVEAVSQEHEQEPESTPAPADGEVADTAEALDAETPAEAAEPVEAAEPAEAKPAFLGSADNFVAPAKSAAAEAAEFVARIFADVQGKDEAESSEVLEVAAGLAEGVEDAGEAQEENAAETELIVAEPELTNKRVLILGLGASGMAMVRWCVRNGADVTVADTREAPPQLATLKAELPQVRFVAGHMDASLVHDQSLDAIYRSPGLFPASISELLEAAHEANIPVGGELDLFAQALREMQSVRGYQPAVLAISGTNGKTTVTSLTALLVQCADKTVAMAGNIGPTLLDTLSQHLDAETLPEVWVLELSSFQLDGVKGFEPTAATVLNITQDHLDWHGSLQAYAAAKARIFGERGLMILNREDQMVMDMLPPPIRVKLQKPQLRAHVTFGGDMPLRPGDFGIEMVAGMAWLVRAHEADETSRRSKVQEIDLHIQRLMPADALRIRGRHNAANALAALALAQAAGCALAPMLFGLREYRGEPHRVESIGIVGDVEFFDDSKGTNVGATVAALSGLGPDRRLVVILGGDGKGQDFSPLALPISRYARAVVLIGRDAPQIEAALRETGVAIEHAESMQQAVQLAARQARSGDAVLMSPACASFDMFDNYGHRAQVFCSAVHDLADDAGQSLEGGA